jgi:16S rRNA processing protein RimM
LTSSTEIEAGRIGRPHGLDGSFHVTRPLPDVLTEGATVRIAGAETRIVRRAGTDAKPIVRVAAYGSRSEVEAARGEPLWVPRDVVGLEEGEWWADDLVGLRVVDGDREVGTVARVRELPSCEVLEVGELLIPLVDDAVRAVDLDAGVVDVDLEFLGEGKREHR